MITSPSYVNRVYSIVYWLKDYAFYPKKFPLCSYVEHGISFYDKIFKEETENDAPLILKYSPRLIDLYKKESIKPVYCIVNPYIHYRKKNKIAKGTLFFPGHSVSYIDDLTDWRYFISNLENIPEQFKPVDICLHPIDIRKGLGRMFSDKGYNVFSAGNEYCNKYAENFYNILKGYKYSMSNLLGSYAFYSVEMGIPFSLFGEEPICYNNEDDKFEKGFFTSYKNGITYKKALSVFEGFNVEVSTEQKEFVDFELGINNTISRTKTSFLLYKALVIYLVKNPKYLYSILKQIFNTSLNKLKYWLFLIPFILYKYFVKNKDWDYILARKKYVKLKEILKLKLEYSIDTKKVSFLKKPIFITNSYKYLQLVKSYFYENLLKFNSNNSSPYIIDCGANIGLSTIYFKQLYPKSKLLVFEADPVVCDLLKKNLETFAINDVSIENNIVWNKEKDIYFEPDKIISNEVTERTKRNYNFYSNIPSIRLKNYLNENVDFLKLNIAGAELEVLEDCVDLLGNVKNIFIELHSKSIKCDKRENVLSILTNAGFEIISNNKNNIINFNIFATRK